jgi:siroheme synthase (precorrin-2 oxidase/ferrochelatase)
LRALRSAGANVRWYTDDVDVAEELLLASAPPGGLELSLSDPLQADYSEFVAVIAASQTALDQRIAGRARARNVPIEVIDRHDLSTFKLAAGGHAGARARQHTIKDIAA